MTRNYTSIKFFLAGILIVGGVFLFGSTMQTDIESMGMDKYMADKGLQGALRFFVFAFGFPVGLGLCAIGAIHQGGATRRETILFVLLTAVVTSAAILVPAIFGRQLGEIFFGLGGTTITFLFIISIWLWGKYRSRLPVSARTGADFQAAGYFCFAIAAWNLCGVGGMPAFLLSPDKALLLETHAFAVGQMKSIMILLIAGWLFTTLGFYNAIRKKSVTTETISET